MATQARVTSLDALERFRSCLIVFLNKAHSSIDSTLDEIRRTRVWVEQEQRTRWETEARRRQQALAQAEQELMSARMTKALDNLTAQQQAVNKARRALEEANDKLRVVKRWTRTFGDTVEPMGRGLNSLRGYLDHDLPRGLAFLVEAQRNLEAYAETAPPPSNPVPAPIETPAEPPL